MIAELVLALHGDKPEGIIEHPWLKGSADILLMADPPEPALADLPFMTRDPEPLLRDVWPPALPPRLPLSSLIGPAP